MIRYLSRRPFSWQTKLSYQLTKENAVNIQQCCAQLPAYSEDKGLVTFNYWIEHVKVEEFIIHSHMVTVMRELETRRRAALRDFLATKDWEPSYLDLYKS